MLLSAVLRSLGSVKPGYSICLGIARAPRQLSVTVACVCLGLPRPPLHMQKRTCISPPSPPLYPSGDVWSNVLRPRYAKFKNESRLAALQATFEQHPHKRAHSRRTASFNAYLRVPGHCCVAGVLAKLLWRKLEILRDADENIFACGYGGGYYS